MKLLVVVAISILSLNALAAEKVIASSSHLKAVSGCYMVLEGRSANFGLAKYCYDVTKHVEQTVILTDAESRGMAVPGSKPMNRSFDKKSRTCVSGSIMDNGLEARCEISRDQLAAHL